MELSIQERLKDLRVERGLTLEQLAEQTHLSKSALGSYEGDNFKDISHYALIELAKFYEVTVDYLLGRSQTKNHPNADLADLRLSDDMIELLKSGRVDTSLLCELARLGFAMSRAEARQLVTHGHFTVNGRKVNIPSYLVKPGMVITLKDSSRSLEKIKSSVEANAFRQPPKWLEYDANNMVAKVVGVPEREDIDLPIEEHLIVELYSK